MNTNVYKLPLASSSPTGKSEMRTGTIAKLNIAAGFGYVSDDDKVHHFVFVFGHALSKAEGAKLQIGSRVRFRTSGQGCVDELAAIPR